MQFFLAFPTAGLAELRPAVGRSIPGALFAWPLAASAARGCGYAATPSMLLRHTPKDNLKRALQKNNPYIMNTLYFTTLFLFS